MSEITPSPADGAMTTATTEEENCFIQLGSLFGGCIRPRSRKRSALLILPGSEGWSSSGSCHGRNNALVSIDGNMTLSPTLASRTSSSPKTDVQLASMRHSSSKLNLRVFPLNREQEWEELSDDLYLILNGRGDHLEHFRILHKAGLVRSNILRSLSYIVSRPSRNESLYHDHISAVASFLGTKKSTDRGLRLASLRTMMLCLSPDEASWQARESVIEGTLQFLIDRDTTWEFMDHSEMILLWEIRAMCLNQIEREQERLDRIANTGDTAAVYISAGAKIVEAGMAHSTDKISQSLEEAGNQVKEKVQTDEMPLMMSRDAVVAMAYSDAAKRASEGALETTRVFVDGLKNVSTRGLQIVSSKFEEDNLGEKLLPHAESREVIKAAGKAGIATIGAAAIVGEAAIDSSRTVTEKTASVTADVVQHKYGTSAAQVVRDAGATAGNLLRTVGNVAMLEGKVIAKSVAKNTGKIHVNNEVAKAKESMRFLEKQALGMFRQAIQPQQRNIQSEESITNTSTRMLEQPKASETKRENGGSSEQPSQLESKKEKEIITPGKNLARGDSARHLVKRAKGQEAKKRRDSLPPSLQKPDKRKDPVTPSKKLTRGTPGKTLARGDSARQLVKRAKGQENKKRRDSLPPSVQGKDPVTPSKKLFHGGSNNHTEKQRESSSNAIQPPQQTPDAKKDTRSSRTKMTREDSNRQLLKKKRGSVRRKRPCLTPDKGSSSSSLGPSSSSLNSSSRSLSSSKRPSDRRKMLTAQESFTQRNKKRLSKSGGSVSSTVSKENHSNSKNKSKKTAHNKEESRRSQWPQQHPTLMPTVF